MNGLILKHLAAVGDLAKLDLEAAAIVLRYDGGTHLRAGYGGAYARGMRQVEVSDDELPPFSLSLNAAQFKAIASMFPDDESVAIKLGPRRVTLRSTSSNASLNQWGEADDESFPEFDRGQVAMGIQVDADALIAEIEVASDFASESYLHAALTGIRLAFNDDLNVMTYDGGQALFESSVPVKRKLKASGTIIVPRQDFVIGCKLAAEGDTWLFKMADSEAVVIRSKNALFRCVLQAGVWPDVSRIMQQSNQTHFQVDAAQIKNLVAGANALKSEPDVHVRPEKGGRISFSTESEAGKFSTIVKGNLETELRYDKTLLGKVTKLGPVLDFYAPDKAYEPTVIEEGIRKCWIVTRI